MLVHCFLLLIGKPTGDAKPGQILLDGSLFLKFGPLNRPTYGKATAANHNGRNYLLRVVIGIVEMANTERHPHKVGNIARLHLLHDRSPVMLNRSRADP